MAARILNPQKTTEYILSADRQSEAPTVFVLRPLTWEQAGEFVQASPLSREQAAQIEAIQAGAKAEKRPLTDEEREQIEAIAPGGIEFVLTSGRQYAIAVRHGLVEIRGLLDQTGSPMTVTPAEFARCAGPEMLSELATEILALSVLPEADRKN